MKKINIIGASTLAALEGNLVMTLLPNVLRRAVRWGSSAVGIACLMITTAAGAGETWDTFTSETGYVNGPVRAVTTLGGDLIVGGQFGTAGGVPDTFGIARWDGRMTADELVAAADRALYRAKAHGRDRVVDC